jgi:tetratricopeptide (TPR) repeat protein
MSPERGELKMDAIRHTYLHFVLDPLMAKRGLMLKRLQPLLASVQTAPLEDSYKSDIGLLVTESLIRAVEARTAAAGTRREAETARKKSLEAAMNSGFILANYFYDSLVKFEGGQEGLREILPDWLFFVDVGKEQKRAENLVFASQVTPELMPAARAQENLLGLAEQRLSAGDIAGAQKLAQQALDQKQGDAGQALFLLARAASLNRDANGARTYFQRALEVARDPRVLAWTHIYLGRMADMQDDRESAVQHYQAALTAGDTSPETKAAAERGLRQPYQPQRTGE